MGGSNDIIPETRGEQNTCFENMDVRSGFSCKGSRLLSALYARVPGVRSKTPKLRGLMAPDRMTFCHRQNHPLMLSLPQLMSTFTPWGKEADHSVTGLESWHSGGRDKRVVTRLGLAGLGGLTIEMLSKKVFGN